MGQLSSTKTDRVKEDLQKKDSISKAVLDACPVPCALNDDFQNITFLNQAFVETLGYTLDDIPTLSDWWPMAYPDPEYRDWVATSWQAHMDEAKRSDGAFTPLDLNIRCKNGTVLTMIASAASLMGKYQGTHLVILFDVTERNRSEEIIRRSEERFRTLTVATAQIVWTTNARGEVIGDVPAWRAYTGQRLEEIKDAGWTSAVHPDDVERVNSVWSKSVETRSMYQDEYRVRRHDGVYGHFEVRGVPILDEDGKVREWVGTCVDITERKESEELIWKHANFDIITGLPNRRFLHYRLEREIKKARRNEKTITILFIDLDRFKEVNDTLGHAKGDMLLVEAADRIGKCVRDTDTVSRQGGDEFTVILSDLSEARVDQIVQEILEALSLPFQLGDGDVSYISASIGITIYPDDATDISTLMKNADQAMYAAKSAGRNRSSYFVASMQAHAQEKLNLTNDLRLALANNELEIYYQPIVNIDGSIDKAEALLRWNHPVRGLISPEIFIPVAEDSGLIHEIGEWVFHEVLTTIESWQRMFGRVIQISVNKSPAQFERTEKRSWMDRMMDSGLPANSITVEITEGLLIKDSEKVKKQLIDFRNNGIEVSIDDFGTGFSALSYLKEFDIDYLKIDRSFTGQLTESDSDYALTEAIIVMAHKLGLKTVAEGVETEAQRDLLIEFGCDYLQGYLYSHPVPVHEFQELLES